MRTTTGSWSRCALREARVLRSRRAGFVWGTVAGTATVAVGAGVAATGRGAFRRGWGNGRGWGNRRGSGCGDRRVQQLAGHLEHLPALVAVERVAPTDGTEPVLRTARRTLQRPRHPQPSSARASRLTRVK